MQLIKGISSPPEPRQPFYFFRPDEKHCFAIPILPSVRAGRNKSEGASLSGRVQRIDIQPVHSANMQSQLDRSLEIAWKRDIRQKMLLNYPERGPLRAEEIRGWLSTPAHAWRIKLVKSLNFRYSGMTIFPPELSCFMNLETLDLSHNPSIQFPELWTTPFKQLKQLNLSGCKLSNFPQAIVECADLEYLDISSNELKDLPDEIAQLSRLKYLCLHSNPFSNLSQAFESLMALHDLEHLDLSGCRLSTLPSTIGSFTRLEVLDLSVNKLRALPDELGQLEQLKVLRLYQNRLQTFPEMCGKLSQLELLELSDNQIGEISSAIGNLSQLVYLHLSGNCLRYLPEEIGELKSLALLDLARNQLIKLPDAIAQLLHLRMFNVSDNRLTGIPEKIVVQIKGIPDFHFSLHSNPLLFLSRFQDLSQLAPGEDLSHEDILAKYQACSMYQCKSPLAALCQEIHRAAHAEVLQEKYQELSSYMKKRIEAFFREMSFPASFQIDLFPEAIVLAVKEKFQKLSLQQKQLMYNTVWKLAGSPKGIAHQWGALHAERNIIRLIDAMELHLELGLISSP